MKALVSLLVVFAVLGSVSSEARSVIRYIDVKVTKVKAQSGHFPMNQMDEGNLRLDFLEMKAYLNLYQIVNCPPNALCSPPLSYQTTVTLKDRRVDGCGSVHYLAYDDKRIADGTLEVLRVQDNRGRKCRDLRPEFEIKYDVTFPRNASDEGNTFRHKMIGVSPR